MPFTKWFQKKIREGLDQDAAKALESAIIRFESEKTRSWSTAHDDDLKTLKRAHRILLSRSK